MLHQYIFLMSLKGIITTSEHLSAKVTVSTTLCIAMTVAVANMNDVEQQWLGCVRELYTQKLANVQHVCKLFQYYGSQMACL